MESGAIELQKLPNKIFGAKLPQSPFWFVYVEKSSMNFLQNIVVFNGRKKRYRSYKKIKLNEVRTKSFLGDI